MGWLNRVWSGLDFWDKEENQRQQAEARRREDEEMLRNARRDAARLSVDRSNITQAFGSPEAFDLNQPLLKVGSQSDYQKESKPIDWKDEVAQHGWAATLKKQALHEAGKIPGTALGVLRAGEGLVEGAVALPSMASHLYDWIGNKLTHTPSYEEKSSRVTRGVDKATEFINRPLKKFAEKTDEASKFYGSGSESVYKPVQVATNLATVVPGLIEGGAALTSKLSQAGKISGESKAVQLLNDAKKVVDTQRVSPWLTKVDEALGGRIGKTPFLRKLLAKGESASEAGVVGEEVDQVATKSRPPAEDPPKITGVKENVDEVKAPTVEVEPGIKSTNLPKVADAAEAASVTRPPVIPEPTPSVPDVTNPIALAKADEAAQAIVPAATEAAPIADFGQAVQAPLKKVEVPPVSAVPPEVQAPVGIDAQGNPVATSDAAVARQLAEEGIIPARGQSPVELEEAARQAAADRAAAEQVAAPLTRERLTNRLSDEGTQAAVGAEPSLKDPIIVEQVQGEAEAAVRGMVEDGSILDKFNEPFEFTNPRDPYVADAALRVLDRMDQSDPKVVNAIKNILDADTSQLSKSAQVMNAASVLRESMPTSKKVNRMLQMMEKAGVEQPDAYREELLNLVTKADNVADEARSAQQQLQTLADDIRMGVIDGNNPAVTAQVKEASQLVDELVQAKDYAAGDVLGLYSSTLPSGGVSAAVNDVARTSMLSSVTGRLHDFLTTGLTQGIEGAVDTAEALYGKVLNKVKGPGTVISKAPSVRTELKGARQGLGEAVDELGGKVRVDDLGQALSPQKTRSGMVAGGGTRQYSANPLKRGLQKVGAGIKRVVSTATEAPTKASEGRMLNRLRQLAYQEGEKAGLTGKALDNYAEAQSRLLDSSQKYAARQHHLKVSNLQRNGWSKALNSVADTITSTAKGTKWEPMAIVVKNQLLAFPSWIGGNISRTLSDANMLSNGKNLVKGLLRDDPQLVTSSLAKLTINGGIFGTGMLMANSGMIVDHDGNGKNYAGRYFKIGNKYIPVAILGPYAAPLIFGAVTDEAAGSEGGVGDKAAMVANKATSDVIRSLGVSATLGGSSAIQSAVDRTSSGQGDAGDFLPNIAAGVIGQYIPSISSDINSVVNQTGANPTREAADTKAVKYDDQGNEVKDTVGTAINQIKNRIPGLSQTLPRKEGELSQNFTDRILKSTHEERGTPNYSQSEKELKNQGVPLKDDEIRSALDNGDFERAAQGLEYKLSKIEGNSNIPEKKKDQVRTQLAEAKLQAQGVPITKDGVQARAEGGEYDKAIQGAKYQLEKLQKDPNASKSEQETAKADLTRLEVTQKGKFPASTIKLYQDISNSEWHKLGDPESEDYDPDLYDLLWKYDEAMAGKGVSRSSFKGDKQKYYTNKGRGGSGGGRSGASKGAFTGIPTQSFNYSFSPIKAQEATYGETKSAIPLIEKVPNYDQSKLKKISVRKGR